MDFIQGRILVCYGDACDFLNSNGWQRLTPTLNSRMSHTSTSTSQGLLLVGGSLSTIRSNTELVSVDGGPTRQGFNLLHERYRHCSIQLSDSRMVLTGGSDALSLVTEYSDLDQQEVTSRELPSLRTGRSSHACGSYMVEDIQVD